MVCHNGKLTGLDTKGLGGFESRYAIRHESEAGLLGVVFTPAGAMTGAPYQVQDGSHWVFENTGLKSGDLFGEKSLHRRCPGGASGHETDAHAVRALEASLYTELQVLAPAPHLFWGLWALVQLSLSDIDFDWETYAHERLRYACKLLLHDHVEEL